VQKTELSQRRQLSRRNDHPDLVEALIAAAREEQQAPRKAGPSAAWGARRVLRQRRYFRRDIVGATGSRATVSASRSLKEGRFSESAAVDLARRRERRFHGLMRATTAFAQLRQTEQVCRGRSRAETVAAPLIAANAVSGPRSGRLADTAGDRDRTTGRVLFGTWRLTGLRRGAAFCFRSAGRRTLSAGRDSGAHRRVASADDVYSGRGIGGSSPAARCDVFDRKQRNCGRRRQQTSLTQQRSSTASASIVSRRVRAKTSRRDHRRARAACARSRTTSARRSTGSVSSTPPRESESRRPLAVELDDLS